MDTSCPQRPAPASRNRSARPASIPAGPRPSPSPSPSLSASPSAGPVPAAPQRLDPVGVAMMSGSALANQLGAATAVAAFPVIGPAGVVAVRQWVAAAALLATARPRLRELRGLRWAQCWPVLALAAVYGTMNLSLYTAISRLGLGLAVTLEFLGPLTVALASSRRRVDLGCALAAAAGVVVLTRPRPSTDYLGIGLALLAALCWACYILLNRLIGHRLPGAQGPALAAGLSALAFIPAGILVMIAHPPTAAALGCAAAAGILSSAVPYRTDMLALRRVPAYSFGIFMSVNPVLAALVGLVLLGQALLWTAWLAIAAIAGANAASALAASRTARPTPAARATQAARATRTVSRHAVGSPPCESSSSGPAAASTP